MKLSNNDSRKLQQFMLYYIDALRSNQYVQITGRFHEETRSNNCFCAIGIMLDQSNKGTWKKHPDGSLCSYMRGSKSIAGFADDILECLVEIDEPLHNIYELLASFNAFLSKIIRLNDVEESDFNTIADYVEAYLNNDLQTFLQLDLEAT